MAFPLVYLLYIYFGFLGLWLIFSLVAIFHMIKYSLANFRSYLYTMIYIAVSLIILIASLNYIMTIDWQMNVSMQEFGNSSSLIEQ